MPNHRKPQITSFASSIWLARRSPPFWTQHLILWHIDPWERSDSVNNSRCYGQPAAYVFAVTSHNTRGDAGGLFCRSASKLYDLTNRVLFSERVSIEYLRIHLWSVKQPATKEELSPLLRLVTRERLAKTLQRSSHSGELLPSKD
jgi:hypothetical protein